MYFWTANEDDRLTNDILVYRVANIDRIQSRDQLNNWPPCWCTSKCKQYKGKGDRFERKDGYMCNSWLWKEKCA